MARKGLIAAVLCLCLAGCSDGGDVPSLDSEAAQACQGHEGVAQIATPRYGAFAVVCRDGTTHGMPDY